MTDPIVRGFQEALAERDQKKIEDAVKPPSFTVNGLANRPTSVIPGCITYVSKDKGRAGFWPIYGWGPVDKWHSRP